MNKFLSNLAFGLSILALITGIAFFYCLFASTLFWVIICGSTYLISLGASVMIEIFNTPVYNS